MLSNILAILVALGSFCLYMAAFFFPEVHRKGDFFWSGVGMFYALVLWFCAGRVTGAVLLGQTATVGLLGWLGWQVLLLRREVTPVPERTVIPDKVVSNTGRLFGLLKVKSAEPVVVKGAETVITPEVPVMESLPTLENVVVSAPPVSPVTVVQSEDLPIVEPVVNEIVVEEPAPVIASEELPVVIEDNVVSVAGDSSTTTVTIEPSSSEEGTVTVTVETPSSSEEGTVTVTVETGGDTTVPPEVMVISDSPVGVNVAGDDFDVDDVPVTQVASPTVDVKKLGGSQKQDKKKKQKEQKPQKVVTAGEGGLKAIFAPILAPLSGLFRKKNQVKSVEVKTPVVPVPLPVVEEVKTPVVPVVEEVKVEEVMTPVLPVPVVEEVKTPMVPVPVVEEVKVEEVMTPVEMTAVVEEVMTAVVPVPVVEDVVQSLVSTPIEEVPPRVEEGKNLIEQKTDTLVEQVLESGSLLEEGEAITEVKVEKMMVVTDNAVTVTESVTVEFEPSEKEVSDSNVDELVGEELSGNRSEPVRVDVVKRSAEAASLKVGTGDTEDDKVS